jgi:8-oxo-dGTP pyrophosphatase MutT (NUDIX family)
MTNPPLPRPAATVVVCRPKPGGFDVLLVKRSGKSGFMAGAEVFPGGRVEPGETHAQAATRETLEEAGIAFDAAALVEIAWWITPEAEPKRFDTRFFIVEVPTDVACTVDAHEAVSFRWLDPRQLGSVYAAGGLVLAPPTLATLEDLAVFSSVAEVTAAVERPLPAIMPVIHSNKSGLVLALPGDPLHPEHLRVSARRTRIVMTAQGQFASLDASATPTP